MSTLQVNLLGVPEIRRADEVRPLRLRKAMALLAYLAVSARPHSRDELVALLWPEAGEHDGRAALRSTLSCLRVGLGGQDQDDARPMLRSEAGMVEVPPGALALDVRELATAARLAREHDDLPGLRATLERAAQSYRGDFLAGFSVPDAPDFEAWMVAQREGCRQHLGAVLARLAAWHEAAGDLPAMLATLERWLTHDPLEQDACRRLLAAYLAMGEVAAGLRAYQTYRATLAAELDAEPGLEIQALAEQLEAARRGAVSRPPRTAPFSGPVLEPPLVGRATHLVALRDHLAQAQHAQPQVVILEGEAGSGKTRLAREFLAWARAQQVDVVDGRAFEVEERMPYAILVEALRPRLERENAPDDLLSDLWLAELTRLLPELRERYPDLQPPAHAHDEGSTHLCEAVVRLLHALAQRRPVVMFLDDVHWVDTATRDLLLYAVRRWAASGTRLLLVLAVRSGNLGTAPELTDWLRRLAREASTTWLELGPLDEVATTRLVEALAGVAPACTDSAVAAFAAWLYAETAGQPFVIAETLRTLLEEGTLGLRADPAGGWVLDVAAAGCAGGPRHGVLPLRVQEAIEARLRRLDPLTMALLAAAAVLETRFTFEQLCQVAEIPERDALAALDTAVRARLLREEATPGWYRFAHDKIRDVVYAHVGTARRQVVQRRALALADTRGQTAPDATHAATETLSAPGTQARPQPITKGMPPWPAMVPRGRDSVHVPGAARVEPARHPDRRGVGLPATVRVRLLDDDVLLFHTSAASTPSVRPSPSITEASARHQQPAASRFRASRSPPRGLACGRS